MMGKEIEHKFLVISDDFKYQAVRSVLIAQGYLSIDTERTVRVRIKGTKGFLTIKGKNDGIIRQEFEYEIPIEDARQMMKLCLSPIIEKIRYYVPFDEHTWEIDEFKGELEGICLAEIEVAEEADSFTIPPFIGEEISNDPRWYNSRIPRYQKELKAICNKVKTY